MGKIILNSALFMCAIVLMGIALWGLFVLGNGNLRANTSTPHIISVDGKPTLCANAHGQRYCNLPGDTESPVVIGK